MSELRVVFMGTPDFAVPTLNCLLHSNHEILAVVSQPDKPKGRGKKIQYTPVKETALAHSIPVLQPQKANTDSFIHELKALSPDVIVVVAFGQILSERVLSIPSKGCINVHGSLLPKYRGAAPIQWALINGDKITGITTMLMDAGMDTGDMLLKEEVEIKEEDTAGTMHDRLAQVGADLLIKTLDQVEYHQLTPEKQNNEDATYAPMIRKELGHIRWSQSASAIRNLVKGLDPWPSAYSFMNGKILKIWNLKKINGIQGTPGEIVAASPKEGLIVQGGDGQLLIEELQLQGKKRMQAEDFLRGYPIENETILL